MHNARSIHRRLTAEKAIRESEERYRIILQSISDEVVIVDDRGIIETINDAVLSRTYLPSFSVDVDVPLGMLFPEPFARRRLDAIEQVIRERRAMQIEEKLFTGSEVIWFSTKINPLFNVDGSCSKAVVVSRNITIGKEREEFLRYFSKSILSAQEDERKRVARELHDGLAQRLAVLGLDLRQIERGIDPNDERLRTLMQTAIDGVASLLDETRRIARNLTPAVLEDIGLTSAIQKVVREFSVRKDVHVQWELMNVDGLFSQAEEIHIYRIIQEVISNIERHADARNVLFTIREAGSAAIEFVVKDDGRGFDVREALASSSLAGGHAGLRGLQERANLIYGELRIISVPGTGTAVGLTVPRSAESGARTYIDE